MAIAAQSKNKGASSEIPMMWYEKPDFDGPNFLPVCAITSP